MLGTAHNICEESLVLLQKNRIVSYAIGFQVMAACPQCGGPLTLLATIEEPAVIVKILAHLGLPTRAPPRAPARLDAFMQTA